MPTIAILPPEDPAAVDAACAAVQTFDWIVFTSVNGVHAFLHRLDAHGGASALRTVRVCAVGPATRTALAGYGIEVGIVPSEYRAAALPMAMAAVQDLRGRRVLLPRGQLAREELGQALREAGADVVEVVVYRTVPADERARADVLRMLHDGRIDAITFTSASTVRSFAQIVGADRAPRVLRAVTVAAIGPVTAGAVRELGLVPAVVPDEYTVPALAAALTEHFRRSATTEP